MTTDQWADFLIYTNPAQKVFVDGRSDFYGVAFMKDYLKLRQAQPGRGTHGCQFRPGAASRAVNQSLPVDILAR